MTKQYGTPGERIMSPDVCSSRKLAACSDEGAQLLFDRLVLTSCDQGRQQGDAVAVKAACFPIYPKATVRRVENWLQQLHELGLIVRYDVDGVQVVQVVEWWRYQAGMRRAYPSRWPPPEGWTDRVYSKKRGTGDDADDPESAGNVPSSGRHEAGTSPPSRGKKSAPAVAVAGAVAVAEERHAAGVAGPPAGAGVGKRAPKPPAWPPGNLHPDPHRAVVDGFVALFAEHRNGSKYAFAGPKDGKAVSELLDKAGARRDSEPAQIDAAVLSVLSRARTMLTHRDDFFRAGDLGTLRHGWNRLAPVSEAKRDVRVGHAAPSARIVEITGEVPL